MAIIFIMFIVICAQTYFVLIVFIKVANDCISIVGSRLESELAHAHFNIIIFFYCIRYSSSRLSEHTISSPLHPLSPVPFPLSSPIISPPLHASTYISSSTSISYLSVNLIIHLRPGLIPTDNGYLINHKL